MGKVVGIDLGTTFSAIAHIDEHGEPEIIPNVENDRMTPSVVMFEEDLVTVGKIAKQNARAVPEQIVEFAKREMGKSKETFFRTFDDKNYSPEELSALVLTKLKQDAEAYLNTEVTDAVITVPAYFRDAEREATRNAGKIAGLNVLQVLNEPTAAALAYGMDQLGTDQNVFVFDLGGGTFDVTLMRVSQSTIQMLATNGDHRLGGKDWDDKIITYVAEMFEIEHGENPLQDLHAYQDLQLNAIGAKESLSRREIARIVCGYNGKTTLVELTREKFQELTAELLERCRVLCDVVLSEGNMTWTDIDTVLLVGGSTRMPMVREMIANMSGKEINPNEINPDEAVALGAAIQGTLRQISEGDAATADVSDAVIERFIGPDGAPKVTVTDGATHNLGLVVLNTARESIIHVMIPKMTAVPCEMADQFGTVENNQGSVLIEVVQSLEQDQRKAEIDLFDQYKLGECTLELPPGLPEGSPIHVTYKYNLDQVLEVTAKSLSRAGARAVYDVFTIIKRPTLDDDSVAQAQTDIQDLTVE
ncbi:MAG: Hsp70 family protein [Candidatus Poribacteria bacterium]|nr:Hsp70 family protein [Candidatus Poribacteria bacterium]